MKTYEQRYKDAKYDHSFTAENITSKEREYYLNILKHCKDISDNDQKINGIGKCNILKILLTKKDGKINANGVLSIGIYPNIEYRTIDADIYIEDKKIIVDMLITRVMSNDNNKEYRVFDLFKIEKDKLIRKSEYNYNLYSTKDNIDDETMKGRLR